MLSGLCPDQVLLQLSDTKPFATFITYSKKHAFGTQYGMLLLLLAHRLTSVNMLRVFGIESEFELYIFTFISLPMRCKHVEAVRT